MNESIPQKPILILLLIIVGVVALWLLFRAVMPGLVKLRSVHNIFPKVLIGAGLVVAGLCWFCASLFGLIAGGFLAVIGAILFAKK